MKKLFMDTILKKTDDVVVVVYDCSLCSRNSDNDSSPHPVPKPEVSFDSFVQLAMKNENTRILLGELLQFFEIQLKENFECQ